jgi:hypothetical protein
MYSMADKWLPTNEQVEKFHLHKSMLASLAKELRELSKKKQEGVLNLTKVKMINRVIKPLKESILSGVPSKEFLDLLDEDALPNNSDAVLIISQYEAALKEFQEEFYIHYEDERYTRREFWMTVEDPDDNGRYELDG